MTTINLSLLILLFSLFSLIGWIWETIFRTIVEKKWQNSGFLFGPVCPIYGFAGVTVVMLVTTIEHLANIHLLWWHVFLLTIFTSAIIEYLTSWSLEKKFHALWWDYSNLPFNLHGRISLFSSIFFGFAGVLANNIIAHFVFSLPTLLPFQEPHTAIVFEGVAFICVAALSFDTGITISTLTEFTATALRAYNRVEQHMKTIVETAVEKGTQLNERRVFEKEKFSNMTYGEMAQQFDKWASASIMRIESFSKEKREALLPSLEGLKEAIAHQRNRMRKK